MEKGLIRKIANKLTPKRLAALSGLAVSTGLLAQPSNRDLIVTVYPMIRNMLGDALVTLESDRVAQLAALASSTGVALTVALKKRSRTQKNRSSQTSLEYKPKNEKAKVRNATVRRTSFVANTQPNFFKTAIGQVLSDMNTTSDDPPVWVNYSTNPLAYSLSLGEVRSNHNIQVYGNKPQVEDFLSRLDEQVKTASVQGKVTNYEEVSTNQTQPLATNQTQPLAMSWIQPVTAADTSEEAKATSENSPDIKGLLTGLGVVGAVVGTILLMQKRQDKKRSQHPCGREYALRNAIEYVKKKTDATPTLIGEEALVDGWRFNFNDSIVQVDSDSSIVGFKRLKELPATLNQLVSR